MESIVFQNYDDYISLLSYRDNIEGYFPFIQDSEA